MSRTNAHNLRLAIPLVLLSTVGYGLNPPFARFAFENGVPVLTSSLMRSLAVIVFTATLMAVARGGYFVPAHLRRHVFCMGLASTVMTLGYLSSVAFIPVPIATMIFFTFPIAILLVSPLIEGNKVPPKRLAMAFVAFGGLLLVIGPRFDALDWRGLVLAAMAMVGIASSFFIGRKISEISPITVGFWTHVISVPIILCVIVSFGGSAAISSLFDPFFSNSSAVASVVAMSVLYVVAYQFMLTCLRHAPASSVAPFYYIEPIISIIAAWLLLGQILEAEQVVGVIIVLLSLFGSAWVSRERPTRAHIEG
ncbi:MAG: DMT family transporter [Hyphomicrobiales bacterium]